MWRIEEEQLKESKTIEHPNLGASQNQPNQWLIARIMAGNGHLKKNCCMETTTKVCRLGF